MYLLQRRNHLRYRRSKLVEFNTLVVPVFPVQNLQNCPGGKFSQECSGGSYIGASESVKINVMLLRKQTRISVRSKNFYIKWQRQNRSGVHQFVLYILHQNSTWDQITRMKHWKIWRLESENFERLKFCVYKVGKESETEPVMSPDLNHLVCFQWFGGNVKQENS